MIQGNYEDEIKFKKNVLIVGSFVTKTKDGHVGGVMFASNSLINSELSDKFNWLLIDTTAESVLTPNLFKRFRKAIERIILFIKHLIFSKVHSILIFSSNGYSFWEKGFMTLLAKMFGSSKVIFAPIAGAIIDDVNRKGLLSNFIKYVLIKSDFIVCQSLYFQNYYKNLVGTNYPNKFVLIENWMDTTQYEHLKITHPKNKTIQILFLSWVEKFKGIIELINATKMLNDDEFQFHLVIAGGGSAVKEVEQLVDKFGLNERVDLIGWITGDQKLKILESSDIYVLPTYNEGYPNSLMEAMAAGKACIATKVGAIPDMIIDGETGLLIESKNPKELYDRMKMLILNNKMRIDLGEAARKKILRDNTISIAVSKFEKLFS